MEDVERAAASAQNAIAVAATSVAKARALVNGGQGGRRALSRVTEAEGYLQRANELLSVDPKIVEGVGHAMKVQTGGMGGQFVWPSLLRKLDRLDPSYRQ